MSFITSFLSQQFHLSPFTIWIVEIALGVWVGRMAWGFIKESAKALVVIVVLIWAWLTFPGFDAFIIHLVDTYLPMLLHIFQSETAHTVNNLTNLTNGVK